MSSWIYHLCPFPNQSPIKAIISLLTYLIYFYHQISCTYTFLDEFYGIKTFLSSYTIKNIISQKYSIIGYVCIPLLLLLTLTSAIYHQDKYSGIRYLLSWVGIRVFPVLRILIQLNVALAAYFTILDKYCIILFVFTAILNLVATFFLQNYSINKDFMMCGNLGFSLIWKIALIINIVASQIIVWYQSEPFYNYILSFRMLCMWGLWIVYLSYGFNIYRRVQLRLVMAATIIAYVATATGQWIDQMVFILKLHDTYYDYVYIMMVVTPFICCTYSFLSHRMQDIFDKQGSKLKYRVFCFKDKIGSFDDDIQTQCFVKGMILDHHLKKCSNVQCYCFKQTHFDSKNNKQCDIRKINIGKSTYTKLLMRCWFQSEVNDKRIDEQLDFAEFLFFKFKNTFKSLTILQQCQTKFQFPFEKLRIARLKKQIKHQNIRLNKELYNGTLDIQFITECQKIFQKLKSCISQVLKNNRSFWSTVYNNRIDLTQLVKIVKPNVKAMQNINEQWKLLSNYFDIQKKWKFYYAWYTLFVKNQKLKPVIIQSFTTQVKQDDIFKDSSSSNKDNQRQSQMIFKQLSAAIHINSCQKSTIKKVSNSFTRLFGYEQAEILQSPLEVLMTDTVSKSHNTLFNEWRYEGKSATQPNYHIRKVYIKHKSGYLIAVNKHIKQLITEDNQLQYVALVKTFDEQQNILIADTSMNIQGMTDNLFKVLGLPQLGLSHNYLHNINLSFIIPKLIKYSDYLQLLNEQDKAIFEISSETKRKLRKKQSIRGKFRSAKSLPILDLPQNQQTNLISQFRITHNFKQSIIDFIGHNYHNLQKHQKFNIIKQTVRAKKSQQTLYQYSCKLNIVPKLIQSNKYYEIQITELTNVNKINNIKGIMKRKTEKTISGLMVSEFHKYFQCTNDNKTFSLQYSNNIFIKQENNKPMKKLFHINVLKNFGRLFFVAFIATTLVSSFINYFIDFNRYKSISKQIIVMQNIDLLTFYFQNSLYQINYYYQNKLPIQYNTPQFLSSTIANIESTFSLLQNLKNSHEFKSSIFSKTINPSLKYGTTYDFLVDAEDQSSLVASYDELDFVMKIFQTVELIKFDGFNELDITDWTVQFLQFYLTPSFQKLLDTVETNLFNHLHDTMDHSIKITVIMYVFFTILFILGMIVVVIKITHIIESFISIISVFTNFNQQDIEKIYNYSNFLSNLFKYLKIKDRQQRTLIVQQQDHDSSQVNVMNNLTFDTKIYQTDNNNNININKKIKKIEVGSILNKIRLQTYGLIIITIIIFVGGCFYCNTLVRNYNNQIDFLFDAGNNHFQHYTTLTRILSAINKKYTNSSLYQSYFSANYKEQLAKLLIFKNDNFRLIQNSNTIFKFIENYNIVYFQNVCKQLIVDNTKDLKECSSVGDNALQFGIQSYVYYFADKAIQYLQNNSSISYSTIFEFEKGLKYVNRFMLQLTDMWVKEYDQTVDQCRHKLVVFSIGIVLGLTVVYLVLFELLIITNLNSQYQTFRNIYEMYMPDYLVTKEKIIKAKLVTDGILNK